MVNVISGYRHEIIHAVETHSVVVISGYPDSYMSSYIPYYLFKAGFTESGTHKENPSKICIAHRRKADVSSSVKSCSVLLNSEREVTYLIGLESLVNDRASILYTTEEALLKKILSDPLLSDYGVIILADLQDRSLNVDILMAVLKRIIQRRSRLRIVLCFQGGDVGTIIDYFKRGNGDTRGDPSCLLQQDKEFGATNRNQSIFLKNVHYIHLANKFISYENRYLSNPCSNYLDTTSSVVWDICKNEPFGNILIFLPSRADIDIMYLALSETANRRENESRMINVIPLQGEINAPKQQTTLKFLRNVYICCDVKDFKSNTDEISYVIDCCLSKKLVSDYINTGSEECIVNSTRDEMRQRASFIKAKDRGKCFRMITEKDFNDESIIYGSAIPEVQIRDLTGIILFIKSLAIGKISDFEFVTKPSVDALEHALKTLYLLNAIDNEGELIYPAGNFMAELSCTTMLSAFLYKSTESGCSEEALTICAMLEVKDQLWKHPYRRSPFHMEKLDAARLSFAASEGDMISYFNIFQLSQYYKNEDDKWFSRHMISHRAISLAERIRKKLVGILKKYQLSLVTCGEDVGRLVRTIFCSFFLNVACKEHIIRNALVSQQRTLEISKTGVLTDGEGNPILTNELQPYLLVRSMSKRLCKQLFIDPSSFIAKEQPDWVVFNESGEIDGRLYMHDVTAIKPEFLQQLVPHYFGEVKIRSYLTDD